MTNEFSNSENLFPAYNQHEVVEKLETGFKKLNDKFINLLEENQRIKQHNKNLQEENQDILRINLELNEKNQEISRNNLESNKKYQEISRNNSNLIQIQRLEVISQNLEKNLKILEVDEIDINTINVFKENNKQTNCNINKNPTTALNYSKGLDDIRIVVGLDFGVTYSGFAYCHVIDENMHTNDNWPWGVTGQFRTNTVLRYDDEFNNVLYWGARALKNRKQNSEPVKLFNLYLGDLPDNLKPKLPIDYKKAITDYLREFGMFIKEKICHLDGFDYFEDVLLVLTIPAEYSGMDKVIMRQCVYNADLIKDRDSEKLQFTTESKATALNCTFMFVDCGKYTTNLTTRKLVRNDPLHIDKVTVQIRDFYGSRLINEEFIKFLRERLGTCDDKKFNYELDILYEDQNLLRHVSEEIKEIMEEIIEIKYNDIKKMFDPIVDRIIRLIHIQLLNNKENCSTIFLTGDFCVRKYLQNRIKEEFSHQVNNISVPALPEVAVVRGAVIYGLSTILYGTEFDGLKLVISSRLLKFTYEIQYNWKSSDDFTHDGKNCKFKTLVKRDTEITPDQTFSFNFKPGSKQISESFAIYYTQKYNIGYCDEPGVKRLGILNIDLSDVRTT
ncbi:21895_t:CDS:2 [Rhizophagus irregularis]|nr:21895_t:CDS:2 [Rhizophagus irregularis]